ncbi:MAG: V-type ATPase subunit, partial [Oscillospiraceae bacterium]
RLSLYKSDISYNQLCEYIIGDTILKKIHFSSHAPVVMLAYIFSSEIEIDNLTTIIEGVRYKMPPEQILENLILNRKESESIVS